MKLKKITPFIWFNGQAEQAANKAQRVMQAMMKMSKLDVKALEAAAKEPGHKGARTSHPRRAA